MTTEPLELVTSYVAPAGGVVRPVSGPVDDPYVREEIELLTTS